VAERYGAELSHLSGGRHVGMGAGTQALDALGPSLAPIRTTMEALHAQGGVPKGWKFLVPPGDPVKGRDAFRDYGMLRLSRGEGRKLPEDVEAPPGSRSRPDRHGLASSAGILRGIDHESKPCDRAGGRLYGRRRLSTMPDYADTMTGDQLVDVVAYLKSLTDPATHDSGKKPMDMKGHK
jgi:hypothetical protein